MRVNKKWTFQVQYNGIFSYKFALSQVSTLNRVAMEQKFHTKYSAASPRKHHKEKIPNKLKRIPKNLETLRIQKNFESRIIKKPCIYYPTGSRNQPFLQKWLKNRPKMGFYGLGWKFYYKMFTIVCPITLPLSFLKCLFVLYRKPKKKHFSKKCPKKPFAQGCPGGNMSEIEVKGL